MSSDPYYKTPHWRRLRALRDRQGQLRRSRLRSARQSVDHTKRRRDRGADTIANTPR